MYFFEITEDIGTRVGNATVAHLDGLWHRFRTAAGALPRYADLGPDRLDWCADDLMVVEPEGDDDFVYRHYGRRIREISGFDMLGKRTSDFRSDVGRFFRDKYAQALSERRPLYTVHTAAHAPNVHTWERLLLPVADGARELVVAYNRPLALRQEFLESVLETTRSGVVCVAALRGHEGTVTDFHVISANQAACAMLGVEGRGLVDRPMSTGLPDQFASRLVAVARDVLATGEPAGTEVHGMHNGVHRYLQVTAARSGDFVTLAVNDVSHFRQQEQVLRELNARLEREAEARRQLESGIYGVIDTDELTGTLSRRGYLDRVGAEVARARRHERDLALLLLDLDHFSAVNEAQGRAVGDWVLARTAEVC